MNRNLLESAAAILICFACSALAQSPEGERRGSIAPGTAADGSRPADGAITGGAAILPGERGGMPETRCDELSGTLREECLRKDQGGASTGAPRIPDPKTTRSPASPPPQNPR